MIKDDPLFADLKVNPRVFVHMNSKIALISDTYEAVVYMLHIPLLSTT